MLTNTCTFMSLYICLCTGARRRWTWTYSRRRGLHVSWIVGPRTSHRSVPRRLGVFAPFRWLARRALRLAPCWIGMIDGSSRCSEAGAFCQCRHRQRTSSSAARNGCLSLALSSSPDHEPAKNLTHITYTRIMHHYSHRAPPAAGQAAAAAARGPVGGAAG